MVCITYQEYNNSCFTTTVTRRTYEKLLSWYSSCTLSSIVPAVHHASIFLLLRFEVHTDRLYSFISGNSSLSLKSFCCNWLLRGVLIFSDVIISTIRWLLQFSTLFTNLCTFGWRSIFFRIVISNPLDHWIS